MLNHLFSRMLSNRNNESIIWNGKSYTYSRLITLIRRWNAYLLSMQLTEGSVVAIQGDYSPNTIALLISLIYHKCITVPIATRNEAKIDQYLKISNAEFFF